MKNSSLTKRVDFIPADKLFIKNREVLEMPITDSSDVLCSIIIPCYNYGRFLGDAVKSALEQTLHNIEIIIVDDGSTDPLTREVVASYVDVEKVQVIQKQNAGLSEARNTGIEKALGKYICCLDADDIIDSSYIERCIFELENHENLGFVYSWVQLFGNENYVWQTKDFDFDVAVKENWTAVSAVFRKSDWRLAGKYSAKMAGGYEDWEYWLRIAQLGRAGKVIKSPLFLHRKHGVSMTQTAKDMHSELMNRLITFNTEIFEDQEWRQELRRITKPIPKKDVQKFHLEMRKHAQNKKNVLVVLPWLKPGGAEVLILDILKGMSDSYNFTIVTTMLDEHLLKPLFKDLGADIFHLSEHENSDECISFLFHLIDTRKIDGVFSSGSKLLYESLERVKSAYQSLKIIDLLHNDSKEGHFLNAVDKSPYIDVHICVSEVIFQSGLKAGIPQEKIISIANGVDIEKQFYRRSVESSVLKNEFGMDPNKPLLCFVGRASTEKRPMLFLNLIERLKEINVQGLCVSSGPLQQEIKDYIFTKGLEKQVRLIDNIKRDDLWKVYQASDLIVNTSMIEGMPLTAIEALAMGCPVVGMSVGNLSSLVENNLNGFIVAKDDMDALQKEVATCVADSAVLTSWKNNSRNSILKSNFTLSFMVMKYKEVFAKQLNPDELIPSIVRGLSYIDIFGGTQRSSVSDVEIKLFWNTFLNQKYNKNLLRFTPKERLQLLQGHSDGNRNVPNFINILFSLVDDAFYKTAHKNSELFSAHHFDYFLIDYIIYVYLKNFPSEKLSADTIQWMNTKVEDAMVDEVPLSKWMLSYLYGHPELIEKFNENDYFGRLGLIGCFLQWQICKVKGYTHPDYLQNFLSLPYAHLEYSEELGISNIVAAVWHSEKKYQSTDCDITNYEQAKEYVNNFFEIKVKSLGYYEHPNWLKSKFPKVENKYITNAKVENSKMHNDSPFKVDARVHSTGINVTGWVMAENGIGEDSRVAFDALKRFTPDVTLIDAATLLPPVASKVALRNDQVVSQDPKYNHDLVFLDAATQFRFYANEILKKKNIDRKIIIVSPWELARWPKEMSFVFEHVDVFWAATEFIKAAFAPYFKNKIIQLAPPAVVIPNAAIDTFDVSKVNSTFVFLTTFDGQSSIHRKNPQAAINAFKIAFPKHKNEDVKLIVKTMNFLKTNEDIRTLAELIANDSRIVLIDKAMSKGELWELVRSTHCFVSLHRSEGFGRNIAEMMLFNRPTIVSNYSGNIDFCNSENSYLVEGKMINVDGKYWYSKGQEWFDADVESAAHCMRQVFMDRIQASKKATIGQQYIQNFHSVEQTSTRYKMLLKDLNLSFDGSGCK